MDEAFVNVWFDKDKLTDAAVDNGKDEFYSKWHDQASAKHANPFLAGADALRQLYPNLSLVGTTDYQLDILNHPGVVATPLENTPLVTDTFFRAIARGLGAKPGLLLERIHFGGFKVSFDKYEYLLFVVQYTSGFGNTIARYILHDGPEDPSRLLLLAAGAWAVQLHDEIWVFNQGYWQKDHGLWAEIQKADWKDVILKKDFKMSLQKDVYGFFSSEKIYKDLGIPWKRGLIMYGPPGNGKTISIKVIMKTCEEQGFTPLYVKSFQSYMGEENSMAEVFGHARQMAPCVLILEDLDSLINDRNRSFFLNQLDGLTGNDGLLVVGTTNHFERLDPGLSSRPSRFDRHFKFDDPDRDERVLYAKYWQNKLKDNENISFPDQLVEDIAEATERFSFAYLKEAFVSSLVGLATYEGDDKPSFGLLIKAQIKTLRKELERLAFSNNTSSTWSYTSTGTLADPVPASSTRQWYSRNALMETARPNDTNYAPVASNGRDVRVLLDTLSASVTAKKYSTTLRSTGIYGDRLPPSYRGVGAGSCPADQIDTDGDLMERIRHLRMGDQSVCEPARRNTGMFGVIGNGYPSPESRGHDADLARNA
ncbi:putative ATPase associated with various cellular activities (AAA) [Lyophyllum shimeji]|uniref:ATPase associated with various cellular activities (AAA) n=1 Tax=Lyophyllum shimeji TaxID=47721 RepID=A0A9P3PE88_LYOSH|nr:putative ATPase associated with various cellular activities (AAA) [Lyophyllum shimeji]